VYFIAYCHTSEAVEGDRRGSCGAATTRRKYPLQVMEGLAPLRLAGIKRPRANTENRNRNRNIFNPKECGALKEGERCELRKKRPGEVYGSYIYELFTKGEKIPVKIRKLATSLPRELNGYVNMDGFRTIRNEGVTYEALKRSDDFDLYCMPFLAYKDEDARRYIDFTYVPGETLQEYIHKERVSVIGRRILLAQSIKCLLFLAEHDRIHGDIKLDNFWYDTAAGRVRVFDFELARVAPPITDRSSPVSLVDEMDRFVNLIEYPDEFGFSAKEAQTLLGSGRNDLLDYVGKSETKEDGLRRLVEVYKGVLKRLAGPHKGGARRRTRRKSRGTK
jgi:serine/threonine protein kinase